MKSFTHKLKSLLITSAVAAGGHQAAQAAALPAAEAGSAQESPSTFEKQVREAQSAIASIDPDQVVAGPGDPQLPDLQWWRNYWHNVHGGGGWHNWHNHHWHNYWHNWHNY